MSKDTTQIEISHRLRLLLLLSVFMIGFYSFSYERMVDPDLWGHLTFGREILESHIIPGEDPYSYMPTAHPWINHEWLCGVIFAFIYIHSGDMGLLLFKSLLGGLIFLMAMRVARLEKSNIITVILLFPVAAISLQETIYVRAHLYTYFFYGTFIWLSEEHGHILGTIEKKDDRWRYSILFMSLLFIIWVNCHPGFVAGLGLLLVYLLTVGTSGRLPFLSTLALCLAGIFANPHNVALPCFMVKTLTMSRDYITEWRGVPLNLEIFPAYKVILMITFLALIYRFYHYFFRQRSEKPFTPGTIILIITAILSLRFYRHIPLFVIASMAFLPGLMTIPLAQKAPGILESRKILLSSITAFFIFSLGFFFSSMPPVRPWNITVPLSRAVKSYIFPVDAVNFMEENNLRGNILCHFDWGEYLIFRLGGRCKVSFDGRLDTVYTAESIKMNLDFTFGREGWRKMLTGNPPDFVMVNVRNRSFQNMVNEKDWVALYMDENCAIFARKGDGTGALVLPPRFTGAAIPMEWAAKGRDPAAK